MFARVRLSDLGPDNSSVLTTGVVSKNLQDFLCSLLHHLHWLHLLFWMAFILLCSPPP